jgi:hypothetical protein
MSNPYKHSNLHIHASRILVTSAQKVARFSAYAMYELDS